MRCINLSVLLLLVNIVFGQAAFPDKGRIYFERKVGQITLMELMDDGEDGQFWREEFKKNFPRVLTDNFMLDFDTRQTFYKKEKENKDNKYIYQPLNTPEADFVFQDLSGMTTTMSRQVFEKSYLVKDSLKKFAWKISNETRDIAGFECRKATAKIADSVVVVAFYTDQIPVLGGPENFNGLPGMILGIAVPRLALTIFATKLELITPNFSIVQQAKNKKFVTRETISKELEKSLKDWGREGVFMSWMVQL